MYAQLDAFVGFTGNTQQFDTIAKLFSVFDIAAVEFADAFQIAGRKVHRRTKCQCAHNGNFMAGIMTFDIKSRVSFGIAQSLSFFQYVCKRTAFFTHFSKNEVASTINNAGDATDLVCSQAFTQSLDNRDTAGNSSFKLYHDIFFFRQRENFIAVFSQQFFIGSNNVFAVFNRFQYRIFGNTGAAKQFNNNINILMLNQLKRIFDKSSIRANLFGFFFAQITNSRNTDFTSQAAADFRSVVLQYSSRTATDCTQT